MVLAESEDEREASQRETISSSWVSYCPDTVFVSLSSLL